MASSAFVARDEILLRGFGGADRGGESRHQREQADGHNDDSGQEFDQRETAFRRMSADELFFLHHCCTQSKRPPVESFAIPGLCRSFPKP